MTITVNGQAIEAADDATGAQLLAQLGVSPATLVVEYNAAIAVTTDFLEQRLKPGDSIELITIVGGG